MWVVIMELSRQDKILKYIIEDFIKTKCPISSQTIIEEHELNCSSATIRNDMAELESRGLIEKAYSSSGRIPSEKGYRYYIENLRSNNLNPTYQNQLSALFSSKIAINEVIAQSCEILSQMTQLTTVMLGPNASFEKLTKIEFIKLNNTSSVAIFITDNGHVENKIFKNPIGVSANDIEMCVNFLSDNLIGTFINEIHSKLEMIKPILAQKIQNHEVIFKAFAEAFFKFLNERIEFFGTNNLFEQPEFTNDVIKLKKMLNLIENNSVWRNLQSKDLGVKVKIGNENQITELNEVSIITANFKIDDEDTGTIALVGPTRMDYEKIISAFEYLAKNIEEMLKKNGE